LAAEETILSFKNAEILKNYFRSKTQFLWSTNTWNNFNH
jgi:hypothetical protein